MTVEAPSVSGSFGSSKPIEERDTVTIRFAGDSGDGMQLTGMQFTASSAIFGNDVCTLPDFPAEIRAPAGTVYGVSGYQVQFGSTDVHTPGDELDALVAMNPAALKTNIADLRPGGILIVNSDGFNDAALKLAHYTVNPLNDHSLDRFEVHLIAITTQNRAALDGLELKQKDADRCKNFYALGLACWLFHRPMEAIEAWIHDKFAKKPQLIEANRRSLKAGYFFGETTELFAISYRVRPAELPPGTYREIRGNEATALGLIAAARLAGKELFYASYPITPASDILHDLAQYKNYGVLTFQAEDEIAAATAAIGAAYGGALAATATSGPGLALKAESIGLAVMTELPMVIVNVQRGGPSTGLPTKTEAADLLQAMFGRNGECPVPILAPGTPSECFDVAIEAVRIALRHMLPVIILSDGYIANGAEPWSVPDTSKIPAISIEHPHKNGAAFKPYARDENLARPWALPGTEGLQHRLGGLEKADISGNVNYEPENHQHMVKLRQAKVDGIAKFIPPTEVVGDPNGGELLLLGWGGTKGSILQATLRARRAGRDVSCVHLRHLNPFPSDLGTVLRRYKRVLVPELNLGQLLTLVRARYLVDARGLNKVKGRPFSVTEILQAIDEQLALPATAEAARS